MPSPAPSPAPSPKGRFLRFLTTAQLGSGLVFSTFLLVHLIPPALVAVTGDERSASGFMLLGRVYYQGALSEPILVYGSLAVHVVSSLLKRAVLPWSSLKAALRSSHAVAGHLLILPVLAHVLTHRTGPSLPSPPISSLSPAEMDYSYVAATLHLWPALNTAAYGALVGLGLWHGLGGLAVIRRRWGPQRDGRRPSLRARKASAARLLPVQGFKLGNGRFVGTILGSCVLAVGLVRLYRDSFVSAQLRRRVFESHRAVLPWLYK